MSHFPDRSVKLVVTKLTASQLGLALHSCLSRVQLYLAIRLLTALA